MTGFAAHASKTLASIVVLGGLGAGIAYLVAPGPVVSAWDALRERAAWTGQSCAAAPLACLDDRADALRQRQGEVRDARSQSETGLRAIEAEESRVRNLLDANLGQQALLRSRANDAALRGAERVVFVSRTYTMPEVAAQAASLVAEQQQFEGILSGLLPPRRDALQKARQQAMLVENSIATTLATVDADRALLLAGRSMDRSTVLLAQIAGTEARATEVLGNVRSTLQLAASEKPSQPAPGQLPSTANFDFSAWRGGRAQTGG
ncbi:MAG: hypothetical protein ACOYOH_11900 [Paracraurococcus sp.]|jgi:hypothetical protein